MVVFLCLLFFCFKQKTAYEMRISDWSSDVCSSDLILADRVGRRTMLAVTAAAIAAFSGFAPQLLGAGEVGEATFMILGFALLGLSFGQSSGALSSNFHPRHRYTGSAFTSDLAWLFGAGFAPMVALWLSSEFGRSEEHTSELQSLMRISYAVFCLKTKI